MLTSAGSKAFVIEFPIRIVVFEKEGTFEVSHSFKYFSTFAFDICPQKQHHD